VISKIQKIIQSICHGIRADKNIAVMGKDIDRCMMVDDFLDGLGIIAFVVVK